MNNYISLMLAVLEHLEHLTADEAKKLYKELSAATLPDSYEAASRLVKDIFTKLELKQPIVDALKK